MPDQESHKFDPARAHLLDARERDEYLPDRTLVDLLELTGGETVLDYGAGTGRVALTASVLLPQGRVIAVDESDEMIQRLTARATGLSNIAVLSISDNRVPLGDATIDRILAINLLHEIRGETALAEMHRLLKTDGLLILADWDRERPSDPGPPVRHRYSRHEAVHELIAAGFTAEPVELPLPYHFVLHARPHVNGVPSAAPR